MSTTTALRRRWWRRARLRHAALPDAPPPPPPDFEPPVLLAPPAPPIPDDLPVVEVVVVPPPSPEPRPEPLPTAPTAPALAPRPVPTPSAEVVDVSRYAELRGALTGFERKVGDVRGAVVASRDGLPLASTFADGAGDRYAAMAASVVGLAEEIVADTDAGTSMTIIRGRTGCLIVHPAGPDAVVAARTGPNPNVGLVNVELPAVVSAVSRSLERC